MIADSVLGSPTLTRLLARGPGHREVVAVVHQDGWFGLVAGQAAVVFTVACSSGVHQVLPEARILRDLSETDAPPRTGPIARS